ncbi:MAG: family NAD(P)-dependent oxidoreductase, partial [Conexibacter sp.]|nr:family NAD(P)-dependent oxidoreductase [Conexibacter sp.]
MDGIDPDRLADALSVLDEVQQLPAEHPDAVAVRRATGRLFKAVKEQRRAQRRAAVRAGDAAVTA